MARTVHWQDRTGEGKGKALVAAKKAEAKDIHTVKAMKEAEVKAAREAKAAEAKAAREAKAAEAKAAREAKAAEAKAAREAKAAEVQAAREAKAAEAQAAKEAEAESKALKPPTYANMEEYIAAVPLRMPTREEARQDMLLEGPPEAQHHKKPTLDDYLSVVNRAIRAMDQNPCNKSKCFALRYQKDEAYMECLTKGIKQPLIDLGNLINAKYWPVEKLYEERPTWPNNEVPEFALDTRMEIIAENIKTARVQMSAMFRYTRDNAK